MKKKGQFKTNRSTSGPSLHFHLECDVLFSCSVMSDSATPWTAAHQTSLSFTISWTLLKLMSTESVMPYNHLILCCLFLLLPSIIPSIRVFSNELALHIRQPKYWSFSFSISPSNEQSGLISFRIDQFYLCTVQEALKSLLHHSLKALILQGSVFFYSPTLTSIHDQWKNHSFDYNMDHCQQSDASSFLIHCPDLSQLFFQGASIF